MAVPKSSSRSASALLSSALIGRGASQSATERLTNKCGSLATKLDWRMSVYMQCQSPVHPTYHSHYNYHGKRRLTHRYRCSHAEALSGSGLGLTCKCHYVDRGYILQERNRPLHHHTDARQSQPSSHHLSFGIAKHYSPLSVMTKGVRCWESGSASRNISFFTYNSIGCHLRSSVNRRFVASHARSSTGLGHTRICLSSVPALRSINRKTLRAFSSSARETPVTMSSPSSIPSTQSDSGALYPEDYQGKAGLVVKTRQPAHENMINSINEAAAVENVEDGSRTPLLLSSGAWALPHPEKMARGGEDAHFYGKNCVGVADGVGGWADLGVDPGIYSKEFMRGTANALAEIANSCDKPTQVMRQAHFYTNQNARGSTTVCFAYLESDGSNILRIANLGDSSLYLIRQGKLAFKTSVQQHDFNFPFQLGSDSNSDTADMTDVFEQKVQKGDVIVLGTDGLTDNVFDDDIVDTTWEAVVAGSSPTDVAKILTLKAKLQSMNQKWESPFSVGATEFGLSFPGGKPDDISITVSFVVEKEGRRRPAPRM